MTMELKIVDFETAKLLRSLKFNEKTEYAYIHRHEGHKDPDYKGELTNKNILHCDIPAPTQELARKFLRDNYGIDVNISPMITGKKEQVTFREWSVDILIKGEGLPDVDYGHYSTYEESLEEGLKQACEYLKEQSNDRSNT